MKTYRQSIAIACLIILAVLLRPGSSAARSNPGNLKFIRIAHSGAAFLNLSG